MEFLPEEVPESTEIVIFTHLSHADADAKSSAHVEEKHLISSSQAPRGRRPILADVHCTVQSC